MEQDYIEIKAKTLEDAITAACQKLSVISDRLDYILVSEGSSGFLGFNAKPAIIKARVKAVSLEQTESVLKDVLSRADEKTKKAEAAPAEGKSAADAAKSAGVPDVSGEAARSSGQDGASHVDFGMKEGGESESAGGRRGYHKDAAGDVRRGGSGESESIEGRRGYHKDAAGDARRGGNRSEGRGGDRENRYGSHSANHSHNGHRNSSFEESVPESRKIPEEEQLSDDKVAEVQQKAGKFLADMFEAMKMQVSVSMRFDKEWNVLELELAGEEMGVLIGKRGQTLDSIQYLVSLIVNRDADKYIHVKADTENYRARRKETLENLARNIAYKVKHTRRPVELEPMNPYERRIIHSALQGDRYVTTHSEGEEPFRRVVVTLKKY